MRKLHRACRRALAIGFWGVAATASGVVGAAGPMAPAQPGRLRLHVPSPDWRDQVIYFVMTDRYANGDPRNDDQGAGEFKPGDTTRYQGGDFAGLRARLPYIQGLGATAVWITPPVANQWLDPNGGTAGYHGYWAQHFMQVDPHLGSLADAKRLSDALHRRGMFLVQDIVLNHTGDYFHYGPGWRADDPAADYHAHTASPPVPRPTQPPFDRNDPRDPEQRRDGIYHWTPDITDYRDPVQEHTWQMGGLDDLNTEHPEVRRALRRSYGWWIREVGVDAFRVDTIFYVPPASVADFLRARDPAAPGVLDVARATGRRAFHVFGEGFGIDRPGEDTQARRIERYMTDERGRPVTPGMLNFPLYGALGDAFARGRAPAELGTRVTAMMKLHARPHLMPSFVDNHDVDRFLAGGSTAGLRQALLAMMTLPGIPVLYYGTEQGLTGQRAAMFAAGAGSGGRDRYDTAAPLYRDIAAMTTLRRTHRLFSRGKPTVLAAQAARPGGIAWRTDWQGRQALVAFNTSDAETLLAPLPTGLPAGTVLRGLYGLDGRPRDETVGPGGTLVLRLPPRAGLVWQVTPQRRRSGAAAAGAMPRLDASATAQREGDFTVSGSAGGARTLRLVVDGDVAGARTITPDARGRWEAGVDTSAMIDPDVMHEVIAWDEAAGTASPPQRFQVRRTWRELLDVADPAGDDHGPGGRYTYPTDPGWGDNRQMDLRRLRVSRAGGALRLDIGLPKLTQPWAPPNGFDHVALTIYIELPGRPGGATVMPLQNASLPDGMRWHLRLRVGGWSNALHGPQGASADSEGTPLNPAATLRTDAATGTVSLLLPASVLGAGPLTGARIHVTTWDYDGGYRALSPVPQAYAIGGGPPDGPKVMDDLGPLVVP